MRCVNVGPGDPAPKALCTHYIACLIEQRGEPPPGAYFWTPPAAGGGAYVVQLCYDERAEVHENYAQIVVLAAAALWTP